MFKYKEISTEEDTEVMLKAIEDDPKLGIAILSYMTDSVNLREEAQITGFIGGILATAGVLFVGATVRRHIHI